MIRFSEVSRQSDAISKGAIRLGMVAAHIQDDSLVVPGAGIIRLCRSCPANEFLRHIEVPGLASLSCFIGQFAGSATFFLFLLFRAHKCLSQLCLSDRRSARPEAYLVGIRNTR